MAAFTEKVQAAADVLLPAVTPVMVPTKANDLEVVGSGVLLRVGPSEFLVTATHVMDQARGGLHIGGQSTIVHVSGRYTQTLPPEAGRASNRIDLAIVPLAERETQYLRDARFLSLRDLELRKPRGLKWPQESITMMLGYPCTRQRTTRDGVVNTPPLYYLALEKQLDEYSQLAWSPDDHILLTYDKTGVRNGAGTVITAPDPFGMSGGGVFRVVDSNLLVAICVEYLGHKRRTVVATRMRHLVHGLRESYSYLTPYLDAG